MNIIYILGAAVNSGEKTFLVSGKGISGNASEGGSAPVLISPGFYPFACSAFKNTLSLPKPLCVRAVIPRAYARAQTVVFGLDSVYMRLS